MQRFLRLGAVMAGALLLTLGCSSGDGGGDSAGSGTDTGSETGSTTGSETGGPDETDGDGTGAETGGDETGGEETGGEETGGEETGGEETPPPILCASDDMCAEGDACACTGLCFTPTTNPCEGLFNCSPGQWCNPCLGHCEDTLSLCDPCAEVKVCDADGVCGAVGGGPCADQGACLTFSAGGSFCGLACISDAGCPTGFTCTAIDGQGDKQCVPSAGTCEDLGLCESDSDCPDGEICSDGLEVCAPGCTEDGQCADGLVCVLGRCVEPCATDDDCEGEAECVEGGHCKIPGACEKSSECPPQTYCHKEQGMCVDGCLQDAHCQDAGLECDGGVCVPAGCQHNYQCAFEEECDKEPAECGPMTKDHCATCDAQAQDAAAACGGDPNLCVTFQDEEGNEIGDYCVLTCEDDPIDKCPQGYGCEHIEAPDAGIDGFYCIRSCWVDPVP